jgi:hypothetical protein
MIGFLVLVLLIYNVNAWIPTGVLRHVDIPGDPAGDRFGVPAGSGDKLAIGVRFYDGETESTLNSGGVFTYQWNGTSWVRDSVVLTPTDSNGTPQSDNFGASLSMDGDKLVVGAPFDRGSTDSTVDAGAVYTYQWIGGVWVKDSVTLRPTDSNGTPDGDYFGSAVSVSGDRLAVAAYRDNGSTDSTTNAGAIYTYQWTGGAWVKDSVILRPNDSNGTPANDWFGNSIALYNDTLVVGAPFDDGASDAESNTGAVYTYKWDSGAWVQDGTTLRATDSNGTPTGDNFGYAVALYGDKLIVGAIYDSGSDDLSSSTGAVYTYQRIGGVWVKDSVTLRATDSNGTPSSDNFGKFMAISGDYLAISAPSDDGPSDSDSNTGAVYTYQWVGGAWVKDSTTLRASDSNGTPAGDVFGNGVSLFDDKLLIYSFGDDGVADTITDAGAVYTYTATPLTESPTTNPTVSPSASPTTSPTTSEPTAAPSTNPTVSPTVSPTSGPTTNPTVSPTSSPTGSPTTSEPTVSPTSSPTTPWLQASDGVAGDLFCTTLATDGLTTTVVAPKVDLNKIYVYNDLGGEQIITAPPTISSFGASSYVRGDKLLVGATNPSSTGRAYIYSKVGGVWGPSPTTTITSSDVTQGNLFGTSVVITEDSILVGAPEVDFLSGETMYNAGGFYEYSLTGTNENFFDVSDRVAQDRCGQVLAYYNKTLLVQCSNRGRVYEFKRGPTLGSWTQTQILTPFDGNGEITKYGSSMSLLDNTLVIGAPQHADEGSNAGAVYTYKRVDENSQWTLHSKLTNPVDGAGRYFGKFVDLRDETSLAVGGLHYSYTYKLVGNTWSDKSERHYAGGPVAYESNLLLACDTANERLEFYFDPAIPPTPPTVQPTSAPTRPQYPKSVINETTSSYGTSVAIYRNWAAVGAQLENDGIVHMYHFNGTDWVDLYDISQVGTSQFGRYVAMHDYWMAITEVSNKIHIYRREHNTNSWAKQFTIDTGGSEMISSLDISTEFVVIGFVSKKAMLYDLVRRTFTYITKTATDGFGSSVSIYDNVLAIGSMEEVVYLYDLNTQTGQWVNETAIPSPDVGSFFGSFVTLNSEDDLIVSAYRSSDNFGSVYTYHFEGGAWVQKQIITEVDGGFYNRYFGVKLTANEDAMLIATAEEKVYSYLADINGTWFYDREILIDQSTEIGDIDIFGTWMVIGDAQRSDSHFIAHRAPTPLPTKSPTPQPTLSPTRSPTQRPTFPIVQSGRGDFCGNTNTCQSPFVCSTTRHFCVTPVTLCNFHEDCFATRVEGYLPQCNFDTGKCKYVLPSICKTQETCASEARALEEVVNKQVVELNITNTTLIKSFITDTATKIANNTNGTYLYVNGAESFDIVMNTTSGTTLEQIINATKTLLCGSVTDSCNVEIIYTRRRLQSSEEVYTITISYRIDEHAYKKLLETTLDPAIEDYTVALVSELGVGENDVAVVEYLPDKFAVEVVISETASKLNAEAYRTLDVIESVVTAVTTEVVTDLDLGNDAYKYNDQVDQCPPEKTCYYRGTCNATTGLCQCNEGFTGALCGTVDESQEPVQETTVKGTGDELLTVVNAWSGAPVQPGNTSRVGELNVYYNYDDFVSFGARKCPQPTYSGSTWSLVFARKLSADSNPQCILQNFNSTKFTYVCCFVRNLGLMPIYQYSGDSEITNSRLLQSGDETDGKWYTVDGDGNSKQNTVTPSPTDSPSSSPSVAPTFSPTGSPITSGPTTNPTFGPTRLPTVAPTPAPTGSPTTKGPSASPTKRPTNIPTSNPTRSPTTSPTTKSPTTIPSTSPTNLPTSSTPTTSPTTKNPTLAPTSRPSSAPTVANTSIVEDNLGNLLLTKYKAVFFTMLVGVALLFIILVAFCTRSSVQIKNHLPRYMVVRTEY